MAASWYGPSAAAMALLVLAILLTVPPGSDAEAQEYSITYVSNGGTDPGPDFYDGSVDHELMRSYRSGYRLEWTEDPSLQGAEVQSIPEGESGDRTFYARWLSLPKYDADFDYGTETYTITGFNIDWLYSLIDEDKENICVDIPDVWDDGVNGIHFIDRIAINAFRSDSEGRLDGNDEYVIRFIDFSSSNHLLEIKEFAFYNCKNLISNVFIPSSVRTLSDYAFYGINGVGKVYSVPFINVESIGDYCFSESYFVVTQLHISGYIISVGDCAFKNSNISSVVIESCPSYTVIQKNSFSGMGDCRYVWIGEGITSIGDYAFSGLGSSCSSDVSVTASGSLQSIGRYAFQNAGCADHSFSFDIPDSVRSIGQNAFATLGRNTQPLGQGHVTAYIGLPENEYFTSIPASMFSGNGFVSESNYPHIITDIPSNVTSIGANAFYKTNSEIWVMSGSITSAGTNAFNGSAGTYIIAADADDYQSYRTGILSRYDSRMTYRFDVLVDADGGLFGGTEERMTYTFLYGTGLYCSNIRSPRISDMISCGSGVVIPDASLEGSGIRRWYDTVTGDAVVTLDSRTPHEGMIRAEWGTDGLVDPESHGYSGTYDGLPHRIDVSARHGVTDEHPETYVWYMVASGSLEQVCSTVDPYLELTDVLQSGTYRCEMILENENRYVLWTDDITVSIAPASVSIQGLRAVNRQYDGGITAEIGGTPVLQGLIEGDDVTVSYGSAFFDSPDAGDDKVARFSGFGLSGNDSSNYTLMTQPSDSVARIDPRPVTISVSEVYDKVYDGNVSATFGDMILNGVLSGDILQPVAGTASFDSARAGDGRTVTFSGFSISGEDSGNYVLRSQPAQMTASVLRKPVRMIASVEGGREYDGTRDAVVTEVVLEGKIGEDSLEVRTGYARYSDRHAGEMKSVEFYGFSIYGADSVNYVLSSQPASITSSISRKPVAITGLSVDGKVYDGTVAATIVGEPVLTGVLEGDDVEVTSGTASFRDRRAGGGRTADFEGFSIIGGDSGNYVLDSQPSPCSADIGIRDVIITGLCAVSRIYDGTDVAEIAGVPSIDGMIEGDDLDVSYGTARFDGSDTGSRTATFSGFSITGSDSYSYRLVSQPSPCSADILSRPLRITGLSAEDKVYDGTSSATISGTPMLSDSVEGDDLSVVMGNASFSDSMAGEGKTVTFRGFSIEGGSAGNYHLTSQPDDAVACILPKTIAAPSMDVMRKVYDGRVSAMVSQRSGLEGILEGDSVSLSFGRAEFPDPDVGVGKTVTFSGYRLVGRDGGNYVLASQPDPVTSDIIPKHVGITGLLVRDRMYDGTDIADVEGVPVIDGMVEGDSVSVVFGTARFDSRDAGERKYVSFEGFGLEGEDSGNYILASQPPPVTASIDRLALTPPAVTVIDKEYDGEVSAVIVCSGNLAGVIEGDSVFFDPGTAVFDSPHAGTGKTVTFAGARLTGDDSGNYVLSSSPGPVTASITKRHVIIIPDAVSKHFGDPDPSFGCTVTGLVRPGDLGEVTCSRAAGQEDMESVGDEVSVVVSSYLDNPDYEVSSSVSVMRITGIPVTVSNITAYDKEYDGNDSASLDLDSVVFAGLRDGDSLTLSATGTFDGVDASDGRTVSITDMMLGGKDAGIYVLAQSGCQTFCTARITPRQLEVSGLSVSDKEYDGGTSATVAGSPILSRVLEGDDVGLSGGSARFVNRFAGEGIEVVFSGYLLSGADASNYRLAAQPPSVTAAIHPKDVTITGITASDKMYDGTADAVPGGSETILGKVRGDDLTVVRGSAEFSTVHACSGAEVVFHGYGLTGGDASNYRLAAQPSSVTADILPRNVSISGVRVYDKLYDGTDSACITGDAHLEGAIEGDDLRIVIGTARFDDGGVGPSKVVRFEGFSIEGDDAEDYVLALQPSRVLANIVPATLHVGGLSVSDKVYDGTTRAQIIGAPVLEGVIGDDDVVLSEGDAVFVSKHASASARAVFRGFSVSGEDSGNYELKQPDDVYARISPSPVSVSGAGSSDKVYDGTPNARITGKLALEGVIGDDDVFPVYGTASFDSADAGTGRTVTFCGFSLRGGDASDYEVAQQPGPVTADIRPRPVVIEGLSVQSRMFDGTVDAVITGDGRISGCIDDDDLGMTYGAAHFDSPDAGMRNVIFSGFGLDGISSTNYVLQYQPAMERVVIDPAPLTVRFSVSGVYDGTPLSCDLSEDMLIGLVEGDRPVSGRMATASADAGTYVHPDGLSMTVPLRTVMGIGNYDVTFDVTAEIEKRVPDVSCFECVVPVDSVYDEEERTADVFPAEGLVGFGTCRFRYSGIPVDAGTYEVIADVDEGDNYTAVRGLVVGRFEIGKAPVRFTEHPAGADIILEEGCMQVASYGHAEGGRILYSLSASFDDASEVMPSVSDPGSYKVFYKAVGDRNHYDSAVMTVTSEVMKVVCEGGCSVIDIAGDVHSANVPISELVSSAAGNGTGMKVTSGSWSVEFDSDAVRSMGQCDVSLSVDLVHQDDEGRGDVQDAPPGTEAVIRLSMGDVSLGGGSVAVSVDVGCEVPDGMTCRVYRIISDERMEELPSESDGTRVTFTTSELSVYAVVYENEGDEDADHIVPVIGIVMVAAVIVCAVCTRSRR